MPDESYELFLGVLGLLADCLRVRVVTDRGRVMLFSVQYEA